MICADRRVLPAQKAGSTFVLHPSSLLAVESDPVIE